MKTTVIAPITGLLLLPGTVSLFWGTGCRSGPATTDPAGKASSKAEAAPAALVANPRPVVVRDFAFEVGQVHADPGLISGRDGPVKRVVGTVRPEETPTQKATRLAGVLSETIAKELAALKIPAQREAPGAPPLTDGLLVTGEFLQVDEGNRLRRAIVGFGAGATEVLVQVAVYDLRQSRDRPVLVYGTGAGSKPMPGAVVTLNPYAMAAKYVLSRNATEKDVRKLGKQIAHDLAQVEAGNLPTRR